MNLEFKRGLHCLCTVVCVHTKFDSRGTFTKAALFYLTTTHIVFNYVFHFFQRYIIEIVFE